MSESFTNLIVFEISHYFIIIFFVKEQTYAMSDLLYCFPFHELFVQFLLKGDQEELRFWPLASVLYPKTLY